MFSRLCPAVLLAALIVPGTASSPGAIEPQAAAFAQAATAMTPEQIIEALRRPENSTGNIADGVEEVTGGRGWMSADMKPIADGKIVGRAWTATLRGYEAMTVLADDSVLTTPGFDALTRI